MVGNGQSVKAVFKQLQDKCLYIHTVDAFSSMLEQDNTAEVLFNAKLLRLVSGLGIYKWLWEDLVLKNWSLCGSHTSFFPSFRNCPSDDTCNKSRHGDVLGNIALERYGDHGKVDF